MRTAFTELPRWIRTVRHLRSSQVASRTTKLIKRRLRLEKDIPLRPAEEVLAAVAPSEDFPEIPLLHLPGPADNAVLLEQLSKGIFDQTNLARELGIAPTNWLLGPQHEHRLWTINFHYQPWMFRLSQLVAESGPDAEMAGVILKQLFDDWFWNCRPEKPEARHLAWNAFAVATRISWWIRSFRIWPEAFRARHVQLERCFLCSLWQHADFLSHHLEWDLRGNHLLRDAVGLAWAGRFFQGAEADRWMQMASQLADCQIDEQVLADGGHFERSPMYHVHIMEDVLALSFLVRDEALRAKLQNCWRNMAECLRWLRHPDGEVALFNDAAMDAVPHPTAMLNVAPQLGLEVSPELPRGGRHLPDFGMVVWQGDATAENPWTVLFDVGPVGPDFQPGHAHADTLSVECSFQGQRLFVDPGTHSYDHDRRRLYDRSTAAHNTVMIDEQSSSEVWHIFRVGRRAKPHEVETNFQERGFRAAASHNGYDHLPGSPEHRRTVELAADGTLQLLDELRGEGTHEVSGGLLVAPEWKVEQTADAWRLSSDSQSLTVRMSADVPLACLTEERSYHPEYGVELTAQRLTWRCTCELPRSITTRIEVER